MPLTSQSTAPSPLPESTPVIILQVMALILEFFLSLLQELARQFALSFGVDIVKPGMCCDIAPVSKAFITYIVTQTDEYETFELCKKEKKQNKTK